MLFAAPPQGQQADEVRLDRLGRTIQAAPNFAPPDIERAGIYIQSLRTPGTMPHDSGQRQSIEALALADVKRVLAIDPTFGLAYSWLGVIHRYNWRAAEARVAFEQAFELNPNAHWRSIRTIRKCMLCWDRSILAANVEILRGNESEAVRHLRASEPMTMTITSIAPIAGPS